MEREIVRSKLRSFTLVEILITLGIIGVVAALTIPTLIDNIQAEQFRSNLKKQFSILTQAVDSLQAKNGAIDTSSTANLIHDLSTQISIINTGTWRSLSTLPTSFYYHCYKNNSGTCTNAGAGNSLVAMSNYGNNWAFITKDGVRYLITSGAFANCDGNSYHVKLNPLEITPVTNMCANFEIDLNGDKGPNQVGVDLHSIYLLKENNYYYVRASGNLINTNCSPDHPNDYNYSLHCTSRMLQGIDMP